MKTTTSEPMDLLAFIASMTDSLAWPLVILVLTIIFHRQVMGLLKSLSSFEGFGAAAKFERGLEEAKVVQAAIEATPPEPEPAPTPPTTDTGQAAASTILPQIISTALHANDPPNASIARDWVRVLEAVDRRAMAKGIVPTLRHSPVTHVQLMANGTIDPDLSQLLVRLNGLRDQAVHAGRPLARQDADEYRRQADFVISRLTG